MAADQISNLFKKGAKYQADIATLWQQHNIRELYIFCSSLSRNFSNECDIDLLVDLQKLTPT